MVKIPTGKFERQFLVHEERIQMITLLDSVGKWQKLRLVADQFGVGKNTHSAETEKSTFYSRL